MAELLADSLDPGSLLAELLADLLALQQLGSQLLHFGDVLLDHGRDVVVGVAVAVSAAAVATAGSDARSAVLSDPVANFFVGQKLGVFSRQNVYSFLKHKQISSQIVFLKI